jgi:hypothetical protein
MEVILENQENIAVVLGVAIAAVAAALIVSYLLIKILRGISKRAGESVLGDSVSKHCKNALRLTAIVIAVRLVLPVFAMPE